MKKTPALLLKDILAAISSIETLTERDHKDPVVEAALERHYITIGEAVRLLPDELKARYKTAEWVEMIGMRNHLVHVYWQVDETVLWETADKDIPELKKIITQMLEEF